MSDSAVVIDDAFEGLETPPAPPKTFRFEVWLNKYEWKKVFIS